jgi:hypothetical protein
VAPGSVEVAQGLAAWFGHSSACPKIRPSASPLPREDVAPVSVEVAPGSTEDVAPGSEDARPSLALASVSVSTGDLLSTMCQWPTTRLVEDALLVRA